MNSGVCDEIYTHRDEFYTEGWHTEGWTSVNVRFPKREDHVDNRWMAAPWKPCLDWCHEYFGSRLDNVWDYNGGGWFEFKREEDALLFTLRWS